MTTPPLASAPDALRPLLDTVLDALREGTRARGGPLPGGGPEAVAGRLRAAVGDVLPEEGDPEALRHVVRALTEGSADPADPLCTAHLHCPPLAVAAAADLAASVLNPSMDSWDQAPAASELEALVTRALANEVYGETPRGAGLYSFAAPPRGATSPHPPAALVTTGGTESNQVALLLARESLGAGLRLVCGTNAHHSLPRSAWLLGLPEPVLVPAPAGTMDPAALDAALTELPGPHLVAATAGTTDAGLIDPLPEIAAVCKSHGARLHVDAAYGAGLLFSTRHRAKLTGLSAAGTVTLDLHKLG
ncbi:MAG: aminotransferase class V-fold PLP-dependent enzyme, partial [Streptomyces sp.]|nr:aminotransferase class V-fold PLP-dependent enzyme [Streptomyces sp.]